MVLDVQERNTFMGNAMEEATNKDGKMKKGMFTAKPRHINKNEETNVYLLCSCGHREYIKVSDELLDKNMLNLLCSGCQKNETFYSNRSYALSYLHLRDKKNMIQLAVAGFFYKFNDFSAWDIDTGLLLEEHKLKIQAIRVKTVITTNKTSHVTYQVFPEKNKIRNISRIGMIGEFEKDLLGHVYYDYPVYKEQLEAWYKKLADTIPSYVLEEWRVPTEAVEFESFMDLMGCTEKLFLLKANPYLQLMGKDIYLPLKRKEERLSVKKARKKIEVFKILIPAISKATMKLLVQKEYTHAYNRFEVLGMIGNKDLLNEAVLSFYYKYIYDVRRQLIEMRADETQHSQRFKKTFIRNFFGTNEIFDRRLVSKGNPSQTGMNIGFINDALYQYSRILKLLKKSSPEKRREILEEQLQLVPKESVKELHDRLFRVLNAFKRENKQIDYSTSETNKWNKSYDTVHFSLAKDTHEMARVGEEMHICVGGYDERVVLKECLIVVGYIEDKPSICVEISKGKIVQIKKKYNELLSTRDGEVTKDMRKYIDDTKASLDTRDFDYEKKEMNISLREHREMLNANGDIGNEMNPPLGPEHWYGLGPMNVGMDDLPF